MSAPLFFRLHLGRGCGIICGVSPEWVKQTDCPRGWTVEKNMCMLDEMRAKRDEIYAIARKHKAEKLWVFGSCARKEECHDSDVREVRNG